METIFQDVRNERARQGLTFGEENHDPPTWFLVLAEEFGEVAEALNRLVFDEDAAKALEDYRTELTQLIAVGVAMLESLERNEHAEVSRGPATTHDA